MNAKQNGKCYLVTGGSRGLGRAVVEALAESGAAVISAQRNAGDGVSHASVQNFSVDLSSRDSIESFCRGVPGRLDGIIGNAGLLGDNCPVHEGSAEVWIETLAVNLSANYLLLRQLRAAMMAAPSCRGVFMTSRSAYKGKVEWSAYSASKAALDALIMAFAAEMADTNVRVNLFSPGPMRTDMRAAAVPEEDPMTLPTPDKLAPAILAMLDDELTHSGRIYDYSTGEYCTVTLPEPMS